MPIAIKRNCQPLGRADGHRFLVDRQGRVGDDELKRLREAGFSEAAIVEIIAHVGTDLSTNYFNHIAEIEIDFPHVSAVNGA